jgi:hypothetical protein
MLVLLLKARDIVVRAERVSAAKAAPADRVIPGTAAAPRCGQI